MSPLFPVTRNSFSHMAVEIERPDTTSKVSAVVDTGALVARATPQNPPSAIAALSNERPFEMCASGVSLHHSGFLRPNLFFVAGIRMCSAHIRFRPIPR